MAVSVKCFCKPIKEDLCVPDWSTLSRSTALASAACSSRGTCVTSSGRVSEPDACTVTTPSVTSATKSIAYSKTIINYIRTKYLKISRGKLTSKK